MSDEPISIAEQIACVERELKLRAYVYPRRVADKKMTQRLADRETKHMEATLSTLQRLRSLIDALNAEYPEWKTELTPSGFLPFDFTREVFLLFSDR